jgi:hypothetical protein
VRAFAVASSVLSLAFHPVPPVFDRIAQCETGNNPRHATRDFISRFGIRRYVWAEYKPSWVRPVAARGRAGERLPSVAEQNAVAVAIAQRAGLTAWSCFREHRREWGM